MSQIKIKVKRLSPDAQALPANSRATDAGYDVVATDDGTWSQDGRYIEYSTGMAVELPPGYHLKMAPRSSNSKFDLLLCNSEGLIDNEYRGELKCRFKYVPPTTIEVPIGCTHERVFTRDGIKTSDAKLYKKGDKIAQLKIEKTIYGEFEWSDELSDTSRGTAGFGSTGR